MQIYELTSKDYLPLQLNPSDNKVSFGLMIPSDFKDYMWFCLEMEAHGGDDCTICLDWAEHPDQPSQIYMNHALIPNCSAVISFPVSEAQFELRGAFLSPYGALRKGTTEGTPVPKEKIGFLKVTISSVTLQQVIVKNIYLSHQRPKGDLRGQPVLDCFGQKINGEWPNKLHSEQELITSLKRERVEAQSATYPQGWSKWGGWMGLRSTASGFFRVEKIGKRWWLVDPDGYVFFSNGICYAERAGVFGLIEEYRELHQWLPEKDGEFSAAWSSAANIPQYIVRNGLDGAKDLEMFNFGRANLIRVFHEDWYEAYAEITGGRLKKMGFNTIGIGTNEYFDEQTMCFLRKVKIPYVVTLRDFPLTKERIYRDFPDVFSDEYSMLCQKFAGRSLQNLKDDPYFIGYFVTNEPEWHFSKRINLAKQLLACSGCLASKKQLIFRLKEKYQTIESLNVAWNQAFRSFDDLLSPVCEIDSNQANEDLAAFEKEMMEKYGKTVSDALRAIDPHHLNLGMRYHAFSDRTLGFNVDYYDVFSVNCYKNTPEENDRRLAAYVDAPFLVGEWHFGAKEGGLPKYGLLYTETQDQRAEACRRYAEAATRCRNLIGIHYFEYNDQPYFGRFDGECYQIGLNDVCHRPYMAVCEMFTEFAQNLYPMLMGEEEPDSGV